jgi:AraC-like DNA-binding protein
MVEIGYDSGFADQSHFIRTFKKYTGLTPSAYLKMAG